METLLAIEDLTKRFGAITAVDGVSFAVPRGQVLGFLGPNGAGKSTTMRMVAGYLAPDAGRASVCGFDVATQATLVRRHLGYLPEGAPTYGEMTPSGILDFVATVRGMDREQRRRRTEEMIGRLGLEGVLAQPIETLSKGFKRRVGLALALLHDPDVLILDEPTDGLDPNQKHEVRTLLTDLAPSKAIVISTHILEEVEALCSRAIVIARGRIVADARPDELLARSAYHNAVLVRLPAGEVEAAKAALGGIGTIARLEVKRQEQESADILAFPREGAEILAPLRAAMEREGIRVHEVQVQRGRLDDVFRQLTQAA